MATTHIETISDTVAFTPVATNLTRWPVYATKEACVIDLLAARGGHPTQVEEVLQRLSNTDTSTWTDVGSRVK